MDRKGSLLIQVKFDQAAGSGGRPFGSEATSGRASSRMI